MTVLSRADVRTAKLGRLLRGTALAACLVATPALAQNLPVPAVAGDFGGATRTNLPGNAGISLDLGDADRVINWASFDVAANRRVEFTTPADTPFAVLNRVTSPNPSDILGQITSKTNITVFLSNPSGITFGPTGGFSGGSLILTTAAMADFSTDLTVASGAAITLAAETNPNGRIISSGAVVAVAQDIVSGKTITATGDVALIAATDVEIPATFGSPLAFTIRRGTTLGSAKVDASGSITAANIRLYGARNLVGTSATDALLSVGSGASLTATAANGKVVLVAGPDAAGVAPANSDLTFAAAVPGLINKRANIAQAGTLSATGAGGSVLLAARGAITGGGDLAAEFGSVTLDAADTFGITVNDIVAANDFTLSHIGSVTLGDISVAAGAIDLATTAGTGAIATGALRAFDAVTVDALTTATVLSAVAGDANPAARDLSITGVGTVTLGGGTATRDILLTSTAGNVGVTGDLNAGRSVTVDAALAATVARGVTATAGNYTVDGASVILGTADAVPTTQSARGFVRITADTTSASGLGALTLRSNALGAGDGANARVLQLSALTDLSFAGTILEGGPASQSALALSAGGDITLGTVRARRIVPATDFTLPFTTAGDFTATDLTVAQDLSITSTTGSLRIGQATSTAGNITLAADAGDITGLAGAVPAGSLDPAFGRANLSATTANRTITATAFRNAQFGTLTAGAGNGALAADQIAITAGSVGNPGAVSVDSVIARNGNARLTAIEGAVTLAGATVRGDLTVLADTLATVTGPVTADGDYRATGQSVALGGTQRAGGLVDITATSGPITGLAGLVLQSNRTGANDAANTRFLRLTATGDAIDFAATSQLLGGTTGQSALALNGTSATPANDATAIRLGIVRARTLTGDLAASSLTTAAAITAVDIVARDGLDLTSTAGAIRIGEATSQTGALALTTTSADPLFGDITGLASGGGFGRATLTASAATGNITVRAVNAAHLVQLGTVTAGTGATPLVLDQIALEGGTVDVTLATARSGGLLVQSTTDDVILGIGSSALGTATIEAQANARLGGLMSGAGSVDVRTATGDVTGVASGGGFTRADLAASAADQSVAVTAAGAVTLGTLAAGRNVTVRVGSAITPSDGAIDLLAVTATTGNFLLDAVSADLTAPVRNGDVTLGTGTAGLDGNITASGDIRLGSALTTTTTGRTLRLAAGTVGLSTDSAAIVGGTITAGTASALGSYTVSASRIALTGPAHSARATVNLSAYGTGASDGITGGPGLTLTANSTNDAAANPMFLRASGGAGISFAASATLLGGADGISANIGINSPVASLTLGTVRARSVQGFNPIAPIPGSLTAPNPVTVTGDVDLAGTVTVLGALSIESLAGDIATRAITVGTAADGDRALTLTATTGGITANGALLAFGDVTLDAFGDIRITGITTSPLPSATPSLGDITLTSFQGNITGLADPLAALATFGIANLQSNGGVAIAVADTASIDAINAQGLIDLDGENIRLGSARSRGGAIDITASGALTGTANSFGGVGTVTADLDARGSIRVTAGSAGLPRAVNLRDLTAGSDITVDADRIALRSATATGGTLTLVAGSTLALDTGVARDLITISGTGAATAPAIAPDFADGVLDGNFGAATLLADADTGTITVSAGGIAQLGTVRAGTLASAGNATQIDLSAGALTVGTLDARNGDILAATDGTIAAPIGSPLYIGTIAAANGVTVQKLGNTGLFHDELRIGRIESGLAGVGANGDVLLDSDASIRLGSVMNAALGSFTARAATDITGLILPAPVGTFPNPPAPAFALLGITADRDIALTATAGNLQAATLDAGRDIDATAGANAWIGGDAIARGGHYRVTGRSVLLGTPGDAVQSAGTDVTIRSTLGGITGGSGLRLTSDRPNSGAATSYLVLDSAAGITFANGLNGDTASTLRGGADGTSADIGIRAGTLQLGNVLARSIGSANGPAGAPPMYTIAPVLTAGGAVSARDITVTNDLVIDTFNAGFGITLDTATSTGGGIRLSARSHLRGRETDTPGIFVRTNLTAALGIETVANLALLGTVDAGTGVRLATVLGASNSILDVTNVITNGGDLLLVSASGLRVDTVTATGDGVGATNAQMLLNTTLPQAVLTTAGDIGASADGGVTDTALGGSATFTSTTGGVRIASIVNVTSGGAVLVDQVTANGTTTGHRDVAITGRRVAIGTSVQSAGGDVSLVANQPRSPFPDVSITAPRVTALGTATITAGFGTLAGFPASDNGSLRLGTVTAGAINLTALDGNITGLAGASDSLDPAHARTTLTATGAITARSGGLTLAGVITGSDVLVEAGDVSEAGVVANNGAIDITRIAAGNALTLTARAATATGGFAGDLRMGATASGQPLAGIAATTAGGTATLTTSGVRGDIVIASGLDAAGNIALDSIANARLAGNDIAPLATHLLRSTGGSVSARAVGDITGLGLPAPVGTAPNPPEPAFGLIDITAATAIALAAGNDLQAATLTAGTDIDATAGGFAWLGGAMNATTGHYRVTGGTVLLGTPGDAVQTAASDVAIRSTVGGIIGGSGLLLTSDSGNTGVANRYVVLDSAAGITFANGLNGDTISTIRGGTSGLTADIGIRLAPGATLQLGNILARTIGGATGPAGVPSLYTITPPLMTSGAISIRDITVAGDLVIDNFASGFDLTLDTAESILGGINLATMGELKGRELIAPGSPGFPDGVYDRTDLTAALGIETLSGFALLGTVDAGTGVSLTTGSARLDATEVIARGGDVRLDSASHLRVDTVTASGDGFGLTSAQMLLNAAFPQASLTTAGDIAAIAGRDVTDTALGGAATFTSTTGGVRIESTATTAGEGVILADLVSARGTSAGHRDVAITGRRIAIGTEVVSAGGAVALTATEAGAAQGDVSITVPLVNALGNATLTTAAGTATPPGIDNGSIRVGSANIGTGSITLSALGGTITGLAGASDSLDPAFDRTVLSAGGTITTRSGGLTLANTVTGSEILMEGGTATRPGALDVTQIAATAGLTLTTQGGDIRLGATATGQPTPAVAATTAGTTATLTTSGARGDIVIASALESLGNITLTSVASARLPGGAPAASIRSLGGNIANIAAGDITGLQLPGTPGTTLTDYGRADFTTGAAGTITLTASGTAQLGTLTAGTTGLPDVADQITATAATIDLTTATANNGTLRLTSTLGDVILATGDARLDATITANSNVRIGTLTAQSGNIAITAGADVSGLANGTNFGRSDLTTGTGTITVTAATGALSLGTLTAGTPGLPGIADQIIASAEAIAIATATANNGTLSLTSTLGDVILGTGTASTNATITAAANTRIDTLTAQSGSIALKTLVGDVVLGTGTAGTDATIDAAANARLGTLTAQSGDIAITAGADLSGLATGTAFGRADLTSGTGTITVTAADGALSLGTVTAGTTGQPDSADQITASAEAIDITTATARNGNLSLTSTLGGVTLGTGDARGTATIAAATDAAIGSLTTRTGQITATATQGAVALTTGIAATDATITAATDVAIGTLSAEAGAIAVTATAGSIAGNPGGGANLATLAAGRAITLTANTGTATLGTVDTVDGAITLTARDAALTGVVNADAATITILRGTGATATRIGSFASAATTPALTLDDAEIGRLAADTVVIGSGTDASDIALGGLTLGTATGDKSLKFLGTGKITLSGAITDAGAVARTLQIGGDATAIDATTATPLALPLASRIEATLGSDTSGASIALPAATVDLRGARITFSDTTAVQGRDSIGSIAAATEGQSDAAAAQVVADRLVSSSGSGLYRNNQSRNVFLKAKLLRVSYSGFALFQNTDPSLQGLGVELNLTTPAANGTSPVLELRSLGDAPANSFALFGTINGFVGRTAGLLPNTVLEFVDPARTVRITQSNSRVNGCVIGSPDRGCLITDAPPPTLRLFDQRQLQLFGVADDLTIPFEPSVGSSNEALIGDFTTTGGLIDPDCTVPDAPGCPTPGARP